METLHVCVGDEVVARCLLNPGCMEIGQESHCDVVIDEALAADVTLLVQPLGGAVTVYTLGLGSAVLARAALPSNTRVSFGDGLSLVRSPGPENRGPTERMSEGPVSRALSLVVGTGREARKMVIRERPLSIGSALDNDLEITDRAVSRHHCRLEMSNEGVMVRDLCSRNGTWLNGARVKKTGLAPGGVLRVGRTDLYLSARGATRDKPEGGLIAESPSMVAVLADVENFANLPWPVLVVGQSGTGKEEVARALHARGRRADKPFVALNAGGLPANLVESELFGHDRGAFTGAVGAHRGVFEQADGGTLFLDEIGELPPDLQTRLLRVLESWTIRRLGSETDRPVDVRLVCATHQDLPRRVHEGTFRADLYYRINRLLIEVLPLAQRPKDVAPLAEHFLVQMHDSVGPKTLSNAAITRLLKYQWPGNARELRNVLSTAAATCGGTELGKTDIEVAISRLTDSRSQPKGTSHLHEVVGQYGGNLAAAARALGIPRSTLRDRLNKAR